MVELLIFDVGGVLRNSKQAIYNSLQLSFKEHKRAFPFAINDVWHLKGVGNLGPAHKHISCLLALSLHQESLPKLLQSKNLEKDALAWIKKLPKGSKTFIESLVKNYRKHFASKAMKNNIKIIPHTKKALDVLEAKGYKLAILTNASLSTVSRDLSSLNLSRFQKVYSAKAFKPKPSPRGIQAICRELKIKPSTTMYIGDSAIDIRASKRAKTVSAAVLTGMATKKTLEKEKPDFLFQSVYSLSKKLPRLH